MGANGTNANNYFNARPQANNYRNVGAAKGAAGGSGATATTNTNTFVYDGGEKPNNYVQMMNGGASSSGNNGGGGGGAAGSKYPVGLEAIKEIAKNTTKADTNHT